MWGKFVFQSISTIGILIFLVFGQSWVGASQQELNPELNYARNDLNPGNTINEFHMGFEPNHVRGGRIYDDFTVELDNFPTTANGLIARAIPTDPAMLLPDVAESWRCSHCHGYDYKGGIYTFQNGATPNLLETIKSRHLDEDYIVNLLRNGFDVYDGTSHINVHAYSLYLTTQAMVDVADFLVNEIYDVNQYIRQTNNESVFNHMPSMFIYRGAVDPALDPVPAAVRVNSANFTCNECHGIDGRQVVGFDIYDLAWTNASKWMHRVNFGTPRSQNTYPGIVQEDVTVHPGVYEVMLTKGLHFGGAKQTADLMEYVQTHFAPEPPVVPVP